MVFPSRSYNIIFFLVTYAIPLTAMAFTYSKMLPVLKSQAIGEVCSSSQMEAIRTKHKAVVMLLALTLVFASENTLWEPSFQNSNFELRTKLHPFIFFHLPPPKSSGCRITCTSSMSATDPWIPNCLLFSTCSLASICWPCRIVCWTSWSTF